MGMFDSDEFDRHPADEEPRKTGGSKQHSHQQLKAEIRALSEKMLREYEGSDGIEVLWYVRRLRELSAVRTRCALPPQRALSDVEARSQPLSPSHQARSV